MTVDLDQECDQDVLALSFIFPVTSGIMGGVQMLIINLINSLASHPCLKVRLYDYSDGLIKKQLDNLGQKDYEFVSLDNSEWCIPNYGQETFILTNNLVFSFPYFFSNRSEVKLLLWDVYYPTWKILGKIKGITIPRFRKFALSTLGNADAVCFMENAGLELFRRYWSSSYGDESYIVPIPTFCGDNRYKAKPSFERTTRPLTVGYIGRAEQWKILPVAKLLNDLSVIPLNTSLIIYTNDKIRFEKLMPPTVANVKVEYKEGFWGENLQSDILNCIDVGFALGTSALEFAKLGVPTILADFSESEFPADYRYRFLHESDGENLGQSVADIINNKSRHELAEILARRDLRLLSIMSHEYVSQNHSMQNVARKLINCASRTRLTVDDIDRYPGKLGKYFYVLKRVFRKNEKFYGWGIK